MGRGPGGVKNWATVWMETMAKHGGGGHNTVSLLKTNSRSTIT